MTQPPSMLASSSNADPPSVPSPHPRGRWLFVARIVWLLLAALLLANFIASIPAYHAQLLTVCTNPNSPQCDTFQPTSSTLEALHQLGLSLNSYAAMYVGVDVAVSLVYLVVGALIFWRKSNEWWGLFFSFVLFLFGSVGVDSTLMLTFVPTPANPPSVLLLILVVYVCLQWGLLGALLLTFPTGRFAPRWTWVLVLLWVLQALLFLTGAINIAPSALFAVEFLLTWGSVAAVQFYRYRRLYTPVQRQQTKWVVFAYAVGVVVNFLSNAVGALVPRLGAPNSPYQLVIGFFSVLLALLIPLSIGIAILRYRLFDIDVIINRTLVYGSLTAILGAIYFGSVVLLQVLLPGVTGNTSPIALVVSTLLIVVLFQPLRRRLQSGIDRRFYREKYNAARVVDQFSAALQQKVALDEVTASLLQAVEETMHPSQMSLWIRSPEAPTHLV